MRQITRPVPLAGHALAGEAWRDPPRDAAWPQRSARQRARGLRRLRRAVARQARELATLLADETGRPFFEVLTQEILPVLETCRYLERNMPRWLRTRTLRYRRPGFLRTRARLRWRPLGRVAVIAPGNFPFSLGLMSAAYFALAGNTVLLKPSERAPRVGARIARLLADSGLAPGVVDVCLGGPEVGRRIVREADIHEVVFFGHHESGRDVEIACAARGIPCVLEMGEGSAALVLEDADLERAAAGIAWSACYADGRACVRTREVHVVGSIGTTLARRMIAEATRLGAARETLPPVTQCVDVRRALAYIAARPGLLGASIWTRDVRRARRLARAVPLDMLWINDVAVGLPNLPWGGRGRAGRGKLFSRLGLHAAAHPAWVLEAPRRGRRPWWPPYTRFKTRAALWATHFYRL